MSTICSTVRSAKRLQEEDVAVELCSGRKQEYMYIMLDHHGVTDPYPKEDVLREQLQHKKDFFTAVNPMITSLLAPRVEEGKRRVTPYNLR